MFALRITLSHSSLSCMWLQRPDGLPPIVTNFYLRQKISTKRTKDKAIDINCKMETAGCFLGNQWVKSLSFRDTEHQDLKVLPPGIKLQDVSPNPTPLWENVNSMNLPISRHRSSRGLWKGTAWLGTAWPVSFLPATCVAVLCRASVLPEQH